MPARFSLCRLSCLVVRSMSAHCLRRTQTTSSLRGVEALNPPEALNQTGLPHRRFHPVLSTVSSMSSFKSLVSSSVPSCFDDAAEPPFPFSYDDDDVDDTSINPCRPSPELSFSKTSGQIASSTPTFRFDNVAPSFFETFGPRPTAQAVDAGSGSGATASSTTAARPAEIGVMVLGGEEPGVYPSQ